MKTFLKISTVIFFAILTVACSSDDDDPAEDDFFAGTYKGQVNYTNEDGDKESHEDAKVTVIKVASKTKYNFEFSDDVPNLNGVEFEEKGDHHLVNVDFEEGVQYIDIDESQLTMHYSEDDQTWEVDAER